MRIAKLAENVLILISCKAKLIWFCSFNVVSQLCISWQRWTRNCVYIYTFIHVGVTILQLYVNTRTDSQTLFFSQAKTYCSIFCHWNRKPQHKQYASCFSHNRMFDPWQRRWHTIPLSLSVCPPPSFFSPFLLASLALTLVEASSHSWRFWLLNLIHSCDKKALKTHGAC